MTSAEPKITPAVDLTDRAAPVDVRSYTERGTLVIGFIAPGARMTLESARTFQAHIDAHIKRIEIFQDDRRHPQNDPTGT